MHMRIEDLFQGLYHGIQWLHHCCQDNIADRPFVVALAFWIYFKGFIIIFNRSHCIPFSEKLYLSCNMHMRIEDLFQGL